MRYLALACDYDGTLARGGRVAPETIEALERVRASGRKVLLVTGRELDDLRTVFTRLDLFDAVVAENGALLYTPETSTERTLAEPPPPGFVDALRRRYVPASVGRVIVATWEPHERVVLEVIRDLGLELHVIFNKGAVMVLPAGVSKASGLAAALADLGLSAHNVVGVGDAENDHAFLSACECGVAVGNSLPTIKERADRVTAGADGDGVRELIEKLIETDLAAWEPGLIRRHLLLGMRLLADKNGGEMEVRVPPYGTRILIAGASGADKSTLASGLLERILEQGYQCCVVDPGGGHGTLPGTVSLGTPQRPPTNEEVTALLEVPDTSLIVNLLGELVADRPAAFAKLLGHLFDLRARAARPHWLMIDEAHQVAPSTSEPAPALTADGWGGLLLVTVEPRSLAPGLIAAADMVIAVGDGAAEILSEVAGIAGVPAPGLAPKPAGAHGPAEAPPRGHALVWDRRSEGPPFLMRIVPPRVAGDRHAREYAESAGARSQSRVLIREAIERR